jgi:hypothetical protein
MGNNGEDRNDTCIALPVWRAAAPYLTLRGVMDERNPDHVETVFQPRDNCDSSGLYLRMASVYGCHHRSSYQLICAPAAACGKTRARVIAVQKNYYLNIQSRNLGMRT